MYIYITFLYGFSDGVFHGSEMGFQMGLKPPPRHIFAPIIYPCAIWGGVIKVTRDGSGMMYCSY